MALDSVSTDGIHFRLKSSATNERTHRIRLPRHMFANDTNGRLSNLQMQPNIHTQTHMWLCHTVTHTLKHMDGEQEGDPCRLNETLSVCRSLSVCTFRFVAYQKLMYDFIFAILTRRTPKHTSCGYCPMACAITCEYAALSESAFCRQLCISEAAPGAL